MPISPTLSAVAASVLLAVAAGSAVVDIPARAATSANSVPMTGPHSMASSSTQDPAGPPRGPGSPTPGARHGRWAWPLSPRPAVLRRFDAPDTRYGPGHRGVDLAAPVGAVVTVVDVGVVRHAGPIGGRGTVSVEHASGLRSTYEPVVPAVSEGDVVAAGQALGTLERSPDAGHCGPTSCLHLGARRAAWYVDPLALLARGRVVLLPSPPGIH
jgi:murein DD-endopeptidase MepM/ murein hydrolase activator NlpD